MVHSHVNLTFEDISNQLLKYVDRYFELRFGNANEEAKAPLRANEKGALQGYLQSFDDKNGKWIERLNLIKNELSKKYKQKRVEEPKDFEKLVATSTKQISLEDRIKIPLKALYMLSYQELLQSEEPIASYDENGNFDRINLNPENLKMAINLFALTGALANRVAHASENPEEFSEAFDYKHKMIAFLLTSVYDYNKNSNEKIECKFAKLPSSSDGHAYPAFTVKLSSPENFGKISLHFGGSLRYFKYAFGFYSSKN